MWVGKGYDLATEGTDHAPQSQRVVAAGSAPSGQPWPLERRCVDGLALQVTASDARSGVLRLPVAGKQREMGLGSFPIVTLAAAREKARAFRDQVAQGTDPIASRQALVSATAADRSAQKTFVEVAAQYIEQHSVLEKPKAHFAVDSHPVNLRPSVDRRAVDSRCHRSARDAHP